MDAPEILDARFPTRNTSLASALGALFIMPKRVQPFSVIRDSETGRQIFTFYFELEGSEVFCGERHVSDKIAQHWANREKFEAAFPAHPLIPIRKALDSRGFLNGVIHGEVHIEPSDAKVKCRTNDIILAAVIHAAGHSLIRFDKQSREFQFPAVSAEFMDAFEAYGFRNEHPISLMRRGLVVREILIKSMRECPRVIHYRNGDPATNEWADCFIPEGMNEKDADILLSRFQAI